MEPTESVEAPLQLSKECRDFGASVVRAAVDLMNARGGQQPRLAAACLMLVRATNALQGVEVLATAGLNAEAIAVMRTVVEHDIDLAYMLKDKSDRRLRLFFGYEFVHEYREAEAINRLHGGTVDPEAMKVIQARYESVKADYVRKQRGGSKRKKPKNQERLGCWAGVSLAERAKACGRGTAYDLPYAEGCAASHAGAQGLRYVYSTIEDEAGDDRGMTFHIGPQAPSGRSIVIAIASYLLLVGEVLQAGALRALIPPQGALFDRLTALCGGPVNSESSSSSA